MEALLPEEWIFELTRHQPCFILNGCYFIEGEIFYFDAIAGRIRGTVIRLEDIGMVPNDFSPSRRAASRAYFCIGRYFAV